jgi:tRNA modification GTPase
MLKAHLYKDGAPVDVNRCKPRQMILVDFIDPKTKAVVDNVLLTHFKAPHSFTGEDTVEIFAHGGLYVQQKIMQVLSEAGFRTADPGEFTRRAFLNGKLDLTEAEGIRALVEASTEQEWIAAKHLASGKIRHHISNIHQMLLQSLALVEAQVDFPDEGDVSHLQLSQAVDQVKKTADALTELRATFHDGRITAQGLRVALIGLPNSGKSTLLNSILGKERAIVSDIPGTTRDYIEEPCIINGRLIRLIDTAGIRDAQDQIESIGIERSLQTVLNADLVILLCSMDQSIEDVRSLEDKLVTAKGKLLKVASKSDLPAAPWIAGWTPVSCKTGSGLVELKNRIAQTVDHSLQNIESKIYITDPRHDLCLQQSLSCLEQALDNVQRHGGEELLAFHLRAASRHLSEMIGEISSEDILDSIFSQFCIGK